MTARGAFFSKGPKFCESLPNEEGQGDFDQLEKAEVDAANAEGNILDSSFFSTKSLTTNNWKQRYINTNRSRPQKKPKRSIKMTRELFKRSGIGRMSREKCPLAL